MPIWIWFILIAGASSVTGFLTNPIGALLAGATVLCILCFSKMNWMRSVTTQPINSKKLEKALAAYEKMVFDFPSTKKPVDEVHRIISYGSKLFFDLELAVIETPSPEKVPLRIAYFERWMEASRKVYKAKKQLEREGHLVSTAQEFRELFSYAIRNTMPEMKPSPETEAFFAQSEPEPEPFDIKIPVSNVPDTLCVIPNQTEAIEFQRVLKEMGNK